MIFNTPQNKEEERHGWFIWKDQKPREKDEKSCCSAADIGCWMLVHCVL